MIKCKCGGSMKETEVISGKTHAYERYKCTSCGAKGSVVFDLVTNETKKRGSVV